MNDMDCEKEEEYITNLSISVAAIALGLRVGNLTATVSIRDDDSKLIHDTV